MWSVHQLHSLIKYFLSSTDLRKTWAQHGGWRLRNVSPQLPLTTDLEESRETERRGKTALIRLSRCH